MAAVAAQSEGSERDRLIEEALALDSPYDVPSLVDLLDADRRLLRSLQAIRETIDWKAHPAAELAPVLAAAPSEQRWSCWCDLGPRLRSLTRADYLDRLRGLAPWLHSLGGPDLAGQQVRMLSDCVRWWP